MVWFGLAMALLSIAVGVFALAVDGGGRRSPMPMLLMGLGLLASSVGWRSTASRLETQIRQLASYGRRFPIDLVRTDLMTRGFRAGGVHVVVARWLDKEGQAREALSEGFDYDPAPLLERDRIEVLADPFHPALCLVAPDTLPPRRYRDLVRETRAHTSRMAPRPLTSISVPLWIPATLVLLVCVFLVWAVR